MATIMSDEEYMVQLGGDTPPTPQALLANIDAARSTLKQEKSEYRVAVKNLLSLEKKYQAAKTNAEIKATGKRKARLVEAEERLKLAVQSARSVEKRLKGILSAAQKENKALCDLYQSDGRQRLVRKQNARFDKFYMNEDLDIKSIGEPAASIFARYDAPEQGAQHKRAENAQERQQRPYLHSANDPRRQESARRPQSDPYGYDRAPYEHRREVPPYDRPYHPDAPYYDRYYPERPPYGHYYDRPPFYTDTRVDPFMYRQNVTISPVSVDLSPLIEEAVKETMAKFVSTIEERVDAYIEALGAKMPTVNEGEEQKSTPDVPVTESTPVAEAVIEPIEAPVSEEPLSDSLIESTENSEAVEVIDTVEPPVAATEAVNEEKPEENLEAKTEAAAEPAANTERAALAEAVAGYEDSVLKKLSALLDTLKAVMNDADALSAACAEISAKQREALEMQKTITESHRSAMREMQGVQVKQKVMSTDQAALVSEQEEAVRSQAEVLEKQKQLAEALAANAERLDAIAKLGDSTESSIKEIAAMQKANAAQSAKTLEAQHELALRQQEIAQKQKDIAAAQKKAEKKAMA